MTEFAPFIVAGIATGAIYGLAAAGLVLTYKTSGIFNFAHGAVAAAAAYIFYELHGVHHVPWGLAAAVSVLVFGPLLGLVLELIARRVAGVDSATQVVATIGILLVITGVSTARYGVITIDFPQFLPHGTFEVADVFVGYDQLITVLVSVTAVAGLFAFFRWSRLGLQMRAVVDNPELLDLAGSRPASVRRAAWVIGCCFAALSGILLAPYLGLDATLLTLLVVDAFGAAAVGRFNNIPLTFGAGIGIGVVARLITKFVPHNQSLAGLPSSLPFLVLFFVLVLSRSGTFPTRLQHRRAYRTLVIPIAVKRVLVVVAAVTVVFLPAIVGAKLPVYTNAAIYVTIFVSLALLVRTSGQLSLCQLTFVAIGATTFSHLTVGAGLPWGIALVLAGLAVVPVGAIVSLPAIRLSGLYLALATFGFGILVERLAFNFGVMFGRGGQRSAARPDFIGIHGARGMFYVCAVVAALSILAAVVINRSKLGRLLRGLADAPVALAVNGADAKITRVIIFCISAFMAGIAGALFLALVGTASGAASGATFSTMSSITLLTVLAIAGRSLVAAPIIAAIAYVIVPSYITNAHLSSYLQIAFGGSALAIACLGGSSGTVLSKLTSSSAWRVARSPVTARLQLRSEVGS